MRGASSKDGKLHGNRQLVEAYNKDKSGGQDGHRTGGHSGGVHDAEGHDEIKQVVGEHGKAHKHVIMRHEDGAGYSSETHHESGHVHHHDYHGSLDEAHEHGMHAMGEEGDGDHAPMDEEQQHGASGRRQNERMRSGSGGLGVDLLPSD